jgi:hypothetical protein
LEELKLQITEKTIPAIIKRLWLRLILNKNL